VATGLPRRARKKARHLQWGTVSPLLRFISWKHKSASALLMIGSPEAAASAREESRIETIKRYRKYL
jgi:hypothetical protein